MNILKKIDDYVSVFTEWLLGTSIILMAVVLISNVIARKVFSNSIPAADEIGVTLVILATFSGIGYAAKKGRHIRMSALFDAVPLKVQKILIILISSVTCATYVYVCFIAFEYIEGEAILLLLNKMGIAASSGSACTSGSLEPSHVMRAMGIPYTAAHGTIRFSLSVYNTEEEIDRVIEAVPPIVAQLRKLSPYWTDKGPAANPEAAFAPTYA